LLPNFPPDGINDLFINILSPDFKSAPPV